MTQYLGFRLRAHIKHFELFTLTLAGAVLAHRITGSVVRG